MEVVAAKHIEAYLEKHQKEMDTLTAKSEDQLKQFNESVTATSQKAKESEEKVVSLEKEIGNLKETHRKSLVMLQQESQVLRGLGITPIWYDDHDEIETILSRIVRE